MVRQALKDTEHFGILQPIKSDHVFQANLGSKPRSLPKNLEGDGEANKAMCQCKGKVWNSRHDGMWSFIFCNNTAFNDVLKEIYCWLRYCT